MGRGAAIPEIWHKIISGKSVVMCNVAKMLGECSNCLKFSKLSIFFLKFPRFSKSPFHV